MEWGEYVSVGERLERADREMRGKAARGMKVLPIHADRRRKMANTFWGEAWCENLESYADYDNRLPRGRTYARNGSVCHLEILPGKIKAFVAGSSLYEINITVEKLPHKKWVGIKAECAGEVGSLIELLQGNISDEIMSIVTNKKSGLFPLEKEIKLGCSCPDWADMCKHVAAVLYGIGRRLDERPELLFVLRGVNVEELFPSSIDLGDTGTDETGMEEDALASLFGVEMDSGQSSEPVKAVEKKLKTLPTTKSHSNKRDLSPALTGADILAIRESMDLSVAEFAQELGVNTASVYRWESVEGPVKLHERTRNAVMGLAELSEIL
jgi:uncharacterized Zn finger protein